MGRAPCCDKANVKKGPWSPEEDATLKSYIDQHGTGGNWIALPQKIGLKRCGKSCRLRWLNYLRPNIRHGGFSEEEDNIICSLYISIGSRWSIIAAQLPGRTDNDIKNYWNTRLKKKLLGKHRKEKQSRGKQKSIASANISDQHTLIFPNPNPHHMVYNEPDQLPLLPPIPYSNEEPRLADHTSIRKLLIKLGGRFSNGTTNQIDFEQLKDQYYPTTNDHHVSMYDATSTSTTQIPSLVKPTSGSIAASSMENVVQLDANVMDMNMINTMLQGPGNVSLEAEFERIMCEGPHKLQGLEFFYDDIINSTRSDWGEMNSLGDFQVDASNSNGGFLQESSSLEEFVVDKMRYP